MCLCIWDDLSLVRRARTVADALLGGRGTRVRKVMDLASAEGFDRAVGALASELEGLASVQDDQAVKVAINVLDVDWRRTTPSQRRALIGRAMEVARQQTSKIPAALQTSLAGAARDVVGATRDDVRFRHGLAISAEFNALDRRIIGHIVSSQANFVRDEYGRRHAQFSERARQIVAEGLEAGLGRDDIAGTLEKAARGLFSGKARHYWDVVAGAFIGRGRSFAQLSSYTEAGIDNYVIEAVLDERTTEVCRFLHGKVFSVRTGLRAFELSEREPESLKENVPWVREAIDSTGRRVLFVESSGRRKPIAEVSSSAAGTRDERGVFSRALSERELVDVGVSYPPFHALCRTTTIPVL